MYRYIKGEITLIDEDVVLENNGIGYKITCPLSTVSKLHIGDKIKLNIYVSVKEDDIALYGFLTDEEIKMFKLLTTVSKIGPKTAVSILSSGSAVQIAAAVKNEDYDSLTVIPGIGEKTAERIIFELKGKMDDFQTPNIDIPVGNAELIEALSQLGYSEREIGMILPDLDTSGSIEEQIRTALKLLGRV